MFNPQPKSGIPKKKKKKFLKRTPLNKVKKKTGEKEIFEEIAEEREWICFVSGVALRELKPQQFAHVLPKALNKYPLFKLYKKNIILLSDEMHYQWDFVERSRLMRDDRFNELFKLETILKEEYKHLKSK